MKTYQLDYAKLCELFPCAAELSKETADKVTAVWAELFAQGPWSSIEEINFCPGVKTFSLQGHINVVTEGALAVAGLIEKYQGIRFDRELIIVLGLLHDVSKLVEYAPAANGDSIKTELGKKIQHGAMGAFHALQKGFSLDMAHLILTHTPMSQMKPLIKEGVLFNYADLQDADMLFMEQGHPIFLK